MHCLHSSPAACAGRTPAWHVRVKSQPRLKVQTFASNSRRIISRTSTGRPRLRVRRELPKKDSSDETDAADSTEAGKRSEQSSQVVPQDTTALQNMGSSDDSTHSNVSESQVAKESNRRKLTNQRRLSEAELLRELNSTPGSTTSMATALLQAFDGDSWGTDDIDGFARVKSETDPIPEPRSKQRASRTAAMNDTQGLTSAASVDSSSQVRQSYASCIPAGVQVAGTMQSKPKLLVQPLYASRNPEVLSALKMMKTSYIMSAAAGDDADSVITGPDQQPEPTASVGQQRHKKQQSEDAWDDNTTEAAGNTSRAASPSSSKQPGSNMSIGDPEGGKEWVSKLETAGWQVKQSPTGEVFLERSKGQQPSQSPLTRDSSSSSVKKPGMQGDARVSQATAGLLTGQQSQSVAPQQVSKQGSSTSSKVQNMNMQANSKVTTPSTTKGSPAVLKPSLSAHPKLSRALHGLKTPEQVLDTICLLYPIWSAAGCRLAAPAVLAVLDTDLQPQPGQAGNALGVAPTPYDAAQALHAVARAAKRSGMSQAQRTQLCTEPSVIGLLEALRTRPPRLSPDQEASPPLAKSLIALYSTAAKAWWINQPPATPAAAAKKSKPATAKQSSLSMPHVNGYATQDSPAGTVKLTPQEPAGSVAASGSGSSGVDGTTSQASTAGPDSQYQQLLAQYLQPSPEDNALKVVQRMRHQTIVSALWAMSVLAGPVLWQIEMEALLSVAGAGATTWECGPGDAGNVAWALATARHWSLQVPRLARAVAAAGGVQCLVPEESCKLLWGLATLNHAQGIAALLPDGDWAWYTPGKGGGDIHDYSPAQLAMVCWSMAVGGLALHPAFKPAWHCLLGKAHSIDHNQAATMVQIWQVALELRLALNDEGVTAHAQSSDAVVAAVDAALHSYRQQQLAMQQRQTGDPSASTKEITAAETLLRKAHAVFIASGKAVSTGKSGRAVAAAAQVNSSYQRQMGNALVALRQMHVLEDVSSGYAVDLSLPHMRVAIEADGPSHFSRVPGPGGVMPWPLGATALKHRHLKAMGWALISINSQEWDAAPGPSARQALLSRRINEAVQERMEAQLQTPVI